MIRRSGVGFSLEHFLSTSLLASSASFYLDGMVSVACADALMVSDGVPMAGRSLRCTLRVAAAPHVARLAEAVYSCFRARPDHYGQTSGSLLLHSRMMGSSLTLGHAG